MEAESDQFGNLSFPSLTGKYAVVEPRVKVYKPGYVGWDSKLIYLGCHWNNGKIPIYEERNNFKMKDQDIYMEPWKSEYSYISHGMFIDIPVDISKAGVNNSKYLKSIRFEGSLRIKERKNNN